MIWRHRHVCGGWVVMCRRRRISGGVRRRVKFDRRLLSGKLSQAACQLSCFAGIAEKTDKTIDDGKLYRLMQELADASRLTDGNLCVSRTFLQLLLNDAVIGIQRTIIFQQWCKQPTDRQVCAPLQVLSIYHCLLVTEQWTKYNKMKTVNRHGNRLAE